MGVGSIRLKTPKRKPTHTVALLVLAFLCGGCLSSFSAAHHNDLSALKSAHLAYIGEFGDGEDKFWEEKRFEEKTGSLVLQMNLVEANTQVSRDKLREKNVALLREVFNEDAALIHRKARLLTDAEAETMVGSTLAAYESALRAECARRGAEPRLCRGMP